MDLRVWRTDWPLSAYFRRDLTIMPQFVWDRHLEDPYGILDPCNAALGEEVAAILSSAGAIPIGAAELLVVCDAHGDRCVRPGFGAWQPHVAWQPYVAFPVVKAVAVALITHHCFGENLHSAFCSGHHPLYNFIDVQAVLQLDAAEPPGHARVCLARGTEMQCLSSVRLSVSVSVSFSACCNALYNIVK